MPAHLSLNLDLHRQIGPRHQQEDWRASPLLLGAKLQAFLTVLF